MFAWACVARVPARRGRRARPRASTCRSSLKLDGALVGAVPRPALRPLRVPGRRGRLLQPAPARSARSGGSRGASRAGAGRPEGPGACWWRGVGASSSASSVPRCAVCARLRSRPLGRASRALVARTRASPGPRPSPGRSRCRAVPPLVRPALDPRRGALAATALGCVGVLVVASSRLLLATRGRGDERRVGSTTGAKAGRRRGRRGRLGGLPARSATTRTTSASWAAPRRRARCAEPDAEHWLGLRPRTGATSRPACCSGPASPDDRPRRRVDLHRDRGDPREPRRLLPGLGRPRDHAASSRS